MSKSIHWALCLNSFSSKSWKPYKGPYKGLPRATRETLIHVRNKGVISCVIHLLEEERKQASIQCNLFCSNALQCNPIQCNSIQCNAMQRNAMPCHVRSRRVRSCPVTRCNVMYCNAVQCNEMQSMYAKNIKLKIQESQDFR